MDELLAAAAVDFANTDDGSFELMDEDEAAAAAHTTYKNDEPKEPELVAGYVLVDGEELSQEVSKA